MAKEILLMVLVVFALCLREGLSIPSFAASCLTAHNNARTKHGAKPVAWDSELAARAQTWADKLNRGATGDNIHDYKSSDGENIAMLPSPNCKDAVEEWMYEAEDYEYEGYCKNPPKMPESYVLHFTQVVWKATKKIGVGISGNWIVVRYSPHGNGWKKFGKNVQC